MFKYFEARGLRKLIGDDLLSKIENVLPVLDKDLDEYGLQRKKILADIFRSFIDAKTFKKKEFRRKFYNRLPEEIIDDLIDRLNQNPNNAVFEEKVNYLVNTKWDDNEETRKVVDYLNLSEAFIPAKRVKRDSIEYLPKADREFKTLKEFQSKVYFEAVKDVEAFQRFIIQMPTGSGKTRTSMEIISNEFKKREKTVVIWLAHSTELCEQAIACFKEVWQHIGNKNVNICRAFGSHNPLEGLPKESAFIVGGFQKLYSLYKNDEKVFDDFIERVSLIIVDESHKVLAPTYKELTKKITYSNACLIGLTATPGRSQDDIFQNKKLAEFFFNKKFTIDKKGYSSVIQYLKAIDVLAYVNFESLTTSSKIKLNKKQLSHIKNKFDFPPGFLKKLGEDQIRNVEILQELIEYLKQGRQTLYFATSLDQSKFINSVLTYFGFNSCHIDGSTDKGTREGNIKAFKDEEIQVICNYGVLTTGFDAPQTDLVFIARPTSSIILYSQMIGRGLRGPAIGGTEECTVCTVKDNIEGLPEENKIYEYFDEYFD